MFRHTNEFRNILKVHSNSSSSVNPDSNTDSTTMTDSASSNYEVYEDDHLDRVTISKEAIHDLRSIAMRMNSSGYLNDCLKVYVSERKSVLDAGFQRLNIGKLSRNNARRLEWGVLELNIKVWIKAAKICFRYYFENEKQLCEQIFQELGDSTAYACFIETITDHTNQLLDIVEALSCIRPASDRLFKILDLHETLSSLLPSINMFFHTQSSQSIRNKAASQVLPKLADVVKEILFMFENSLANEQSPVVHGQPIHRLPKYVMHYVYKLCDHKQTLMGLSISDPPLGIPSESLGLQGRSQFSIHVTLIVTLLVSSVETKARLCKDASACCFFAMNNIHYIIQKIKGRAELKEMVGDDGFKRLLEKFEQAKADYLKLTLEAICECLKDEGFKKSGILSLKVSRLTDRLKRFNVEFEKLQMNLVKLVVPDFGLVLELRDAIVERVVVAYSLFLVQVMGRLEKHVKYSAEGLETAIQEFFIATRNR